MPCSPTNLIQEHTAHLSQQTATSNYWVCQVEGAVKMQDNHIYKKRSKATDFSMRLYLYAPPILPAAISAIP